ncbi:aminoglycoside phosphotransferase family protein [Streptomyces spongiae]|uniref:Aminoglycoside phosphotransferase family protein n=1 Tax=Streptomyces spongiae TaxID=565072 RepID=A0A5N8XAB1_9ACTN|nr:aminoglycoside phosphotransferase family protein [Streptomyces spongiae]MPY55838.1 aminoglycoside phosphotransferase family protein [Streptomyces spongiae]
MTSFEELHNLKILLKRNDVSSANWVEMRQLGFSGARIYKQSNGGGRSYVVKVTSVRTDWIMRATSDESCREAVLADVACVRDDRVESPAIGSAQDGPVFSILMQDISEHLLSNERLTRHQLEAILSGMARLHSLTPASGSDVPWCSIEDRLTLFRPDPAKLARFRIADDILRGWELFFDRVPGDIGNLVRSLFDDISPLENALGRLPNCFLHGDLKLDNIAIRPDGTLSLIDWSMAMTAPAAVDLGWFLAMNSRVLPISLDETISAYMSYSKIENGFREIHQDLTVLCGLLIRGWRKALDAESGEPSELLWWCKRASSASNVLGAR